MPSSNRTQRYLSGVFFGYLNMLVTMAVGLWLTPFLLVRIGLQGWGLWLIGNQVLGYLMLMDLGIVALLPREASSVLGKTGGSEGSDELSILVGQTTRLVLWQTPVVAIAAITIWFFLPGKWEPLRGPLGLTLGTFVVLFPARVCSGVLQGLQDFSFLGKFQMVNWIVVNGSTIALVLYGFGLYALALGWLSGQVLNAVVLWLRLRTRFPSVLPRSLPTLSWSASTRMLRQGFWASLGQIATAMMNNTDVMLIGQVLGPSAVVSYSCTGKLISVAANQPHLLIEAAGPGLAELKATTDKARLRQVGIALTQAIMLASGAISCVVLVANHGFVSWWVGSDLYAGLELSVLLVLSMMLRHWNASALYTLFYLGHERRLTWTGIADAVVTVTSSLVLLRWLGIVGMPLGTMAGVCLVSIPANLSALAREMGAARSDVLKPLTAWLWRFAVLAILATVAGGVLALKGVVGFGLASVTMALLYGLFLFSVALAVPLGLYVRPRLAAVRSIFLRPNSNPNV